ncbi:MAG: hypothetical protein INR65_04060 [Gluconacetobacter diazotrophicus]|nr:hypothetical protein [Gluconacetobacter diazotrophicus]
MVPFLAAVLSFAAAAVASALAILLSGGGRGLDPRISGVSLGVGLLAGCAAYLHTRRLPANDPRRSVSAPLSPWAWLVFAAFALFALRSFCWLVYPDGAHDGQAAMVDAGNPNNHGDISLHMLYARYFANGVHWWPDHPQAAGYRIRYYPGIDLFQALLLSLGANDYHALVWVGLAGSLLSLLALYSWGGSFAVAGFLFAGGLAGFQYLQTGTLVDFQTKMAWKSLPLAIFVTQRPFLFALPAGLLLMSHWREKFFAAPADPPLAWSRRGLIPFWVELLLYAVLPAFHVFAFVFLSVLLGGWFVGWFARAPMRWHLLALVGAAFLPATGMIYLMTDRFRAGSNVALQLGWMMDDEDLAHLWLTRHLPFLGFWLDNFGLFVLLGPALWLLCAWTVGRRLVAWSDDDAAAAHRPAPPAEAHALETAAAFVLPSGVMFLAACVWKFAPWAWDNTKLMIWCYLAALPFLWERFVRPRPAAVRVAICTLLFFSGAVTLAGGLRKAGPGRHLLETAELDSVRAIVHDLPAEARFAAVPDYNHPLVYCGRKLALGYVGHVHSQGIDYVPLARDLDTLMLGGPGWREAAARLGVRYVFWGPREEKHYEGSTLPWADPDEPVAKGDYGTVYEIKPAAGKDK